jgi:plasmid stabilization system protein ParE
MAKINWTAEAEKWLRDIHDYIAQNNPVAARKVVAGIYKRAQVLANFPQMGYKYFVQSQGDIRILLYGHYRIAYLIKGEEIDILGVFHGALDIDRYLI